MKSVLPIIEYPESTEINKHFRNVYSVSVPITHTVTLEQPGHTRQVIYHAPPAHSTVYQPTVSHQQVYQPTVSHQQVYQPTVSHQQVYQPTVYQPTVYQPTVYQPSVYQPSVLPQVYQPSVEPVYHAPRTVIRRIYAAQPWAYQRYASTWC
ncbi:hypothetical protein MSG28_004435 [Choristoneura fumiferana]|uniref:Uncharacterized protein n=1 Tax=Choristoneura fumiferana TaxID=7141 RepID=A0ACC0K5W8_CHOFU|nr:hypothetical protein MSG28_004435 [Choristoneura fumiferana]